MTTAPERPTMKELVRRLEPGRLVLGWFAGFLFKAYGVGAATAVALSDAETVGEKTVDGMAAIPTLVEEYRRASYVVDHREEIQGAADYLSQNVPPQAELEQSAERAAGTLRDITTTYDELQLAKDALPNLGGAWDHANAAWEARPSGESLDDLARVADQLGPLADRVQVLIPAYYSGLNNLADNFASDEIVGTVFVMGLALLVGSLLGQVAGFWIRRGRPGFIAHVLQGLGARHWRSWYVEHMPHSMSPALHDAARERIRRDLLDDLRDQVDAETIRRIEEHFEGPARR